MLRSAIKFARLRIIITCYALVFLGSASTGLINLKTILAFFLIAAVTIHANSINDYADREIDKINLKDASDRPLVTQDISLKEFWLIHSLSAAAALLLAVPYGTRVIILTAAVLAVDYLYSIKPFRLAYKAFASPLLLSIAYVYYSFTLGYFSIDSPEDYPWLLTIGLLIGFAARMLLKDFRDVKGDKRHGKETFLVKYGARATCRTSLGLWMVAMILILQSMDYAKGIFAPLMLGIVMIAVMLEELSKRRGLNGQQMIIMFIARTANFSILTIMAFLLSRQQGGLSPLELQLIPGTIGIVLLTINWFDYSIHKHGAYDVRQEVPSRL